MQKQIPVISTGYRGNCEMSLPIFKNAAHEALRSSLRRESFGIGWGEFEADQPFTGNAVSVDFR